MLPIWSFLAVTIPLVLTPGASTAVVLRNSISGGTRAGIQTAAGVNSGSLLYGLISAFGLSLTLRRWPSVWVVLRIAGAAYLAWLGIRSLSRAIWPDDPARAAFSSAGRTPPGTALQHAYQGFLTNTLNPAIASFYLIVVPQCVARGTPVARSVLVLTIIHIALALSWHIIWAIAGGTLARTLSGGWPRRTLDACTGTALLYLAGKVAGG